ncbi:MAG: tail fiber protein [Rhodospirillaceae bacterium]
MLWSAPGFVPVDWQECAGQILNVSENQALFSILGNAYGGNGSTTFALPDLRGRVPVGVDPNHTVMSNANIMGDKGGSVAYKTTVAASSSVTIGVANMPAHTHVATFTGGTGGTATASGPVSLNVTGTSSAGTLSGATATINLLTTATTGAVGAPTASNTMLGKVSTSPGTSTLYYPNTSAAIPVSASVSGGAVSAGTVSGTASGNVSLPVTGSTGGGTVSNANTGGGTPLTVPFSVPLNVPTIQPFLALRYIICVTGMYPMRP